VANGGKHDSEGKVNSNKPDSDNDDDVKPEKKPDKKPEDGFFNPNL
jgi:hypothetical protein